MQRHFYRLLCFFALLAASLQVKAIDERYAAPALRGNQLATDSTSLVMDTVYFNSALKPLQTTFFLKNIITFQIDESYRSRLPDEFGATIKFQILYTYDDNGTPATGLDTISMSVGYSVYTTYGFKSTYVPPDKCVKVQIKIISIDGDDNENPDDFKDALILTNEILINREYNFSCTDNAVQTIYRDSTYVNAKGELKVYWSPERAADEYDLEWSFIDSAALANYRKANSPILFDRKKYLPVMPPVLAYTRKNI